MKIIKTTLLSSVLLLSACSTSDAENNAGVAMLNAQNNPPVIAPKMPVYASLIKTKQGDFVFSDFSFERKLNAIKLNDLTHTFSQREVECATGLIAAKQKRGCSTEPELFRSKMVDADDVAKNIFANILIGSVSMGLGVAGYYTTEFNEEAFSNALDSALQQLDRQSFLRQLQVKLNNNQHWLNSSVAQLEEKYRTLNNALLDGIKTIDNSELLVNPPTAEVGFASVINDEIQYDFNWTTLADFEQQSKVKIQEQISIGHLAVKCAQLGNYQYLATGCDQTWNVNSPTSLLPIKYTVNAAKRFQFLIAPNVKDENIAIVKTDQSRSVTIYNRSDRFVTLNSLSLYIGDKIESLNNLNIELPPRGVDASLNIEDFTIFNQETVISNATKLHLLKPVQFGFAAKYTLNNSEKEKTIFQMQTRMNKLNGDVI